jgi:2-iminoacetate synthase ThiH
VQGLTLEECATLLNIDVNNKDLMEMVYDTAFAIKNRIYGNRIVLFAPLYIANYCVNSCTYCAFRAGNKSLQVRSAYCRAWQVQLDVVAVMAVHIPRCFFPYMLTSA